MRRSPFDPVDAASIAALRVAFGAVMLWEVSRYYRHGWIDYYYVRPEVLFPYRGFGWLEPWPEPVMYAHFAALGVLAALIGLGLFHRVVMPLFAFGFAYVFLLDQTHYLNHLYLVTLLAGILCFVPAHHAFSLDARRRPELRSRGAPRWALWLLRFQIGVPYFFGGIAKTNPDWLRGEPMRAWLSRQTDFPWIGGFFSEEWVVLLFSYGGLAFDLGVVPALLWRRTRPMAYAAAVAFHLFNSQFFTIGIFPWFMIAATTIFFEPGWPRRALRRLGLRRPAPALHAPPPSRRRRRLTLAGLGAYGALQLALPLRHYLCPGFLLWTGEGKYFAWYMRAAEVHSRLELQTADPTTHRRRPIDHRAFLTRKQARALAARPDMLLQFSRFWADRVERATGRRLPVYARLRASLNGRPAQEKIDPDVDLSREPRGACPARWILPLEEP